jgi:hypothetical protein
MIDPFWETHKNDHSANPHQAVENYLITDETIQKCKLTIDWIKAGQHPEGENLQMLEADLNEAQGIMALREAEILAFPPAELATNSEIESAGITSEQLEVRDYVSFNTNVRNSLGDNPGWTDFFKQSNILASAIIRQIQSGTFQLDYGSPEPNAD